MSNLSVKLKLVITLLVLFAAALLGAVARAQAVSEKPNIVFILVENVGWEVRMTLKDASPKRFQGNPGGVFWRRGFGRSDLGGGPDSMGSANSLQGLEVGCAESPANWLNRI